MFQSINFAWHNPIKDTYLYILNDTCFTTVVELNHQLYVTAVVSEYANRKLPIVDNIVRYYLYRLRLCSQINLKWLMDDRDDIDTYFSHINYGKKYYSCVKKRLEIEHGVQL